MGTCVFPSALTNAYRVQYQSNLNTVGNDATGAGLKQILNDNSKTPTNEVEVQTWDGSWVKDIYLPKGSDVPAGSKVQITCGSTWGVNVHYPNVQTGGFNTKTVSKGQVLIVMLTSYNRNVWIAPGDKTPEFVPVFPSSLKKAYQVVNQSNLNKVGNDSTGAGFKNILNDNSKTPTNEVEVKTWDGSWVKHFYLPNGSDVPAGSKVQFTCGSTWGINVHYPNVQTGGYKTKTLSKGQVLIVMLTPCNRNVWVATGDKIVEPTRSPTRYPTRLPTRYPTRLPTRIPTRAPTNVINPVRNPIITKKPTRPPTSGGSTQTPTTPKCGSFKTKTKFAMPLGPYNKTVYTKDDWACSGSRGFYYARSAHAPDWMHSFGVSKACEYYYRTPETDHKPQYLTDMNDWFDQIAVMVARQDNKGYRVSPKDVVFKGDRTPNYKTDLLTYGIEECPETYCVKVIGPSLGRKQVGKIVDDPTATLLYAFSSKDAWLDFVGFMTGTMYNYYSDNIFKTNDFMRCGCESFCHDNDRKLNSQATCYVEEQCGTQTYQIAYSDDYSSDKKAAWERTGTTQIMDWFNECASAMFGCTLSSSSKPLTSFSGGAYNPPTLFYYTSSKTFGLGGDAYAGFPLGSKNPEIIWTCPSTETLSALNTFGSYTASAGLFQRSRASTPLPTLPCNREPKPPTYPPIMTRTGPSCNNVNHKGFCFELSGGTCYIQERNESCSVVDFVFQNSTSSVVTGDVEEWYGLCVEKGAACPLWQVASTGKLTYNGMPGSLPYYLGDIEKSWALYVYNRPEGSLATYSGADFFKCGDWVGAYLAQNFTNAAGNYYKEFGNSYGDLFKTENGKCTSRPTARPTLQPTGLPSMAPTLCSESYLDSSSLNINLVIDLSLSTYEKSFSSTVDIGDVNGDGKGNTILDAQIVAIEDLLKSITASSTLNNKNCEIHITTFHTDAQNHGTWEPSNAAGDGINQALMAYIKKWRTPKDLYDVYLTNNGYTNFDAALDKSVEYFSTEASPNRLNLLVFLSDGEPNVRGDGDEEGYCADRVNVWFAEGDQPSQVNCADLKIPVGEAHKFCRSNDSNCVPKNAYQDCVRGPDNCLNAGAVTQYGSELKALDDLKVERLAIGVGDESNVQSGSALWMIDNNPAKDLGVLPVQALDLEALSAAVKSLCILNTESPTTSPSVSPSVSPTESPAPSSSPTIAPTLRPTAHPTESPSEQSFVITTPPPTKVPTKVPTTAPTLSPSDSPTPAPSTSEPTDSPTLSPTVSPSSMPSDKPSLLPTTSPTVSPSSSPTLTPTTSPSASPSGSFFPSSAPTDSPTTSPAPSASPTEVPSGTPSSSPTTSPSSSPTTSPSTSPSSEPTDKPSSTPTTSPSASPTTSPTTSPSSSPSAAPTESPAPTFFLPDCYDAPKMVAKDSSDMGLCYFNPDMIEVSNMNKTDVSIRVQNVWQKTVLPSDVRVFVHSNGVQSVNGGGDGFQCLDNVGDAIDIQQGGESKVKCYQEEGGKWLGVVDVVVTDPGIETNSISHPCHPERDELMNSCSWRLIVPCDSEDLCSEAPTDTPSGSPSALPSSDPTVSPTPSPSSSPTTSPSDSPTSSPTVTHSSVPTGSPTSSPTVAHSSEPTSAPTTSPPTESPTNGPTSFFEETNMCPSDLILLKKEGVTNLPQGSIRIIDQDVSTVTVKLMQAYTSTDRTIDSMYYQFQPDSFDRKCLEKKDVPGRDATTITIQCTKTSQIALLEVWIADPVVLSKDDKAIVPDCCQPTVSKETPATKYLYEIKCVSACGEETVA